MILEAELLQGLAKLPVEKRAITNLRCLNEAYDYPKPSSFSRGMRIDLNGLAILLISGTASIDESGQSVHIGDFRAQLRRTFQNITLLLEAEGATWHDIVRTTCYLRDIERDYEVFNWFTSTHPASRFVQNLIAARVVGERRLNLFNDQLTSYWPDGRIETVRLEGPQAAHEALRREFGIGIEARELERAWPRLPLAEPA